MNNEVLDTNKLLYFFVMLIFSVVFGCSNVYASEVEDVQPTTCEYSDEYIKWTKLSEEEKNNTLMPPVCDNNSLFSKQLKKNVRLQFNNLKAVSDSVWDIRETGYEAEIRNQGGTGMCWAFSSLTALEIFMMKTKDLDMLYSPTHMEYSTTRYFSDGDNEWGFDRPLNSGGNFLHSSAYLTARVGPVLEADMPFTGSLTTKRLDSLNVDKAGVDVKGVSIAGSGMTSKCSATDISNIKQAINRSGAVGSTIYMIENPYYYKSSTAAYYYNGYSDSNHAVTIVGWDDSYTVNNFSSSNKPTRNGAWIVQNSYGTSFGENGYFYVSYDDVRICNFYSVIEDVDLDVEDNSYIHDNLGFNSFIGYSNASSGALLMSGYGMSVFEKEAKKELLKEITIGTRGPGSYKLYYYPSDGRTKSVSSMTLIGEGRTSYEGYQTHTLETPILIDETITTFSIVMYVETDYLGNPLAVDKTTLEGYSLFPAEERRTYKSYNGNNWVDLSNENYILSLRAFTDDYEYDSLVTTHKLTKEQTKKVKVDVTLDSVSLSKRLLSVEVINYKGEEITNYNISYNEVSGIVNSFSLNFYDGLPNGDYGIKLKYNGKILKTVYFKVYMGIASSVYTINTSSKTIYITTPTEINNFLSNIQGNFGNVKNNGSDVSSGYVGTGMTIDGYVIVLKGDVTGEGEITPMDYVKIKNHIMGSNLIPGQVYGFAADYDNNNIIEPLDYVKVKNFIMKGA